MSDISSSSHNGKALSEHESKLFLQQFGIPAVIGEIARTPEEAASCALKIGLPVVLKGNGRNLLHKTERGLVHIGLTDAQAVKQAAAEIQSNAGKDLEGFSVQPCIEGKREFVAGLFLDQQFGPVIMFGLGGIYTEVLSDVSFRLAPLTRKDAIGMIDEIRSASLLDDFRGEKAVDRDKLINVLLGLSKISSDHPEISEIDINPIVITPKGDVCAVDALVIQKTKEQPLVFPPPVPPDSVKSLFYPRSVAFIGASGHIGKWGYTLLTNTISGGYEGKVYLVNQKGGEIAGRPVYQSVMDIPGSIDVAVVTIPAEAVPELIPQFRKKGIRNMLLIASGFSETGEDGKAREKALVKQARDAGISIIGPNTMGICNPHINFYCSGTHFRPKPGSTSIVAQSGNMGSQLIAFAELQGIGIRGFCGSGNESMITIEDYLEAFELDDLTKIVMLYIESVKNGRRFFESAKRVGLKKPIVLLKGGQSKAGRKAASSHTGAISSDTKIFNAVCKQAGIIKVEKPMDLLDLSACFSSLPLPEGNRVAIMTLGGGWGVVTADLCEAYGLSVPDLTPDIIKKIDKILPSYWSKANPIDLVGEKDMSIPMTVMEDLIKWDGCDAVINLGIMGRRHLVSRLTDSIRKSDPTCSPDLLESINKMLNEFEINYVNHIVKLMEQHKKPIVGVCMVKDEKDLSVHPVNGGKFKGVFFPTPEQAVKSLAKMYEYHRFLERERE
ncbi:MAG: acetate--CoA ligase family protein [Desulfobacterales bacterium]